MARLLVRLTVLVVLVAAAGGSLGWYQLHQYLHTPMEIPEGGVALTLERGGSLGSVAHRLASRQVLNKPRWLRLYSRLSGRGVDIHAGEYWLNPGLTPEQLLTKLETGDVRYYEVTLVEGWTLAQVLQRLEEKPNLVQTLNGGDVTAETIGVEWDRSLEGMFFPDTYRFHSGDTDVTVLRRAFMRLQRVLAEEWERRQDNLPYDDSYEALIMASLVEKETGYAPERERIAGVFVRRLQRGMRLQTDPTIIYGLGAGFDGNLRRDHLQDPDNPYNTYRHHGLTPTPIALAGREAIHAALNPAQGEALYFVARGDGRHYFSNTLDEHLEAVRQYQIEQRRDNYSSSPPSSDETQQQDDNADATK